MDRVSSTNQEVFTMSLQSQSLQSQSVQSQSVQSQSVQSQSTTGLSAGLSAQSQPTLRIGDSGAAVERLQQQLSRYVSSMVSDGLFGSRTYHAVQAFQYSRFLSEDGIVGPATWNALVSGEPRTLPTLSIGEQRPEVVWVQQILASLGVYRSIGLGAAIDGLYGPATENAVRRYQRDRRLLGVDGIVGPSTWQVLASDRLRAANYPIYNIQQHNRQKAHTGSIQAIATVAGVRALFTGSTDTFVQRWDEQGNTNNAPDPGDRGSVSDVVINPISLDVSSSTFGGTIRTSDFRQTATFSRRNRFPGRGGSVRAIDIPRSGEAIAAGNTDTSLRLFDLQGKLLGETNIHEGDVTGVAFNPREERFGGQVISADTAEKVVISTGAVATDPDLQPSIVLSGASPGVAKSSVAISQNGYYAAVAGGPRLRIFSTLGGLLCFANYGIALNDVAFSPCGRYLALACGDRLVRVLDLFPNTFREADIIDPVYTLSGHQQAVTAVAFSHDSAYLYSGSANGELITWEIDR